MIFKYITVKAVEKAGVIAVVFFFHKQAELLFTYECIQKEKVLHSCKYHANRSPCVLVYEEKFTKIHRWWNNAEENILAIISRSDHKFWNKLVWKIQEQFNSYNWTIRQDMIMVEMLVSS